MKKIKTIEDYKRIENRYNDSSLWKFSETVMLNVLGYFTYTDIWYSLYSQIFSNGDLFYDKYHLIDGDAKYNYLFDIGDMDNYGILVESVHDLINEENIKEIVTENTYLFEKTSHKKIIRFSHGDVEALEKLK